MHLHCLVGVVIRYFAYKNTFINTFTETKIIGFICGQSRGIRKYNIVL